MRSLIVVFVGLLLLSSCMSEATKKSMDSATVTAEKDTAEAQADSAASSHTDVSSEEGKVATDAGENASQGDAQVAEKSSSKEAVPSTKGGSTAKLAAPVDVKASIFSDSATLEVQFNAVAEDVKVRVWGTDGLEVKNGEPQNKTTRYERGQTMTLEVSFEAPENECNLAIGVSGEFRGQRERVVRSFTVKGSKDASEQKPAEVQLDDKGRKIHVLKAD